MVGPYDPHAKVPVFREGAKEVKGSIPVQWQVAKDVPFTAFDGIEYHGQPVSELRHANTIRTYFQPPFHLSRWPCQAIKISRWGPGPGEQTQSNH